MLLLICWCRALSLMVWVVNLVFSRASYPIASMIPSHFFRYFFSSALLVIFR